MRILNGVMCVVMLLFAVVQYNDPDALLWATIYGLAAVWAGVAAFRTGALSGGTTRLLLALSAAGAIAGVLYYWPDTPHWWWTEVWWETETAREGMGMMIVLCALVLVSLTAATRRRGV